MSLQAPWQNQLDIYSGRDDLSWIKGQHSLKFGAFLGFNGKDEDVNSATGERPSIGSVATNAGGIETNDTLANLELTGNIFNINETSTNVRAQLRWRDYEFYAGDTWKTSPRLTLELRHSLLASALALSTQRSDHQLPAIPLRSKQAVKRLLQRSLGCSRNRSLRRCQQAVRHQLLERHTRTESLACSEWLSQFRSTPRRDLGPAGHRKNCFPRRRRPVLPA